MRRPTSTGFSILLAAALAGCDPALLSTLPSVEAEGEVAGVAFLDRNGNEVMDAGVDRPAPGTLVRLALGAGGGTPAAVLEAGADGAFPTTTLPAGTYTVRVDALTFGDSIELASVDSARFTVTAGGTADVVVQLRYRARTLAEIRAAAPGVRVTTDVVVLNAWGAFGDSTVHVRDATGSLRLRGVPAVGFAAGDSVRVVAITASRDGRPTLADPVFFGLGTAAPAAPPTVSAADARTAGSGGLDAALVRVAGTVERDPVAVANGDVRVTISDPSGPVQVLLDRDAGIGTALPIRAGGTLEVTGLLVPAPATPGEWQLKPRRSADVHVTYPLTSIADARAAIGRFVRIQGVALNDGVVEGFIHVADAGAAVRARSTGSSTFVAGDSVELHGEMQLLADGRPAMQGAQVVLLGDGPPPRPIDLSTATAASANGGALDAALVRVTGAAVDTAFVAGELRARVNDGSGPVTVVFGAALGIELLQLPEGRPVDVVGLLLPVAGQSGTWVVRPRGREDVVLH